VRGEEGIFLQENLDYNEIGNSWHYIANPYINGSSGRKKGRDHHMS
jgi:hypothetical protein